jgi:hypothetical protein
MENKDIRNSTDSLVEKDFTPATSKQCWALRCATGIDYRNQNLSFEKAKLMIQEANEKSGYVSKPKQSTIPTILQYLASNESIELLKKSICDEIEIKSILISVDIENKPIENAKKYVFLGSGCGFSSINWDKRNSRANRTIEKAREISKDIDNLVIQSFDKEIIQYLKDCGNPIQAIQAQNMNYKICYNQLIVDYLVKFYNVENIFVDSRLD